MPWLDDERRRDGSLRSERRARCAPSRHARLNTRPARRLLKARMRPIVTAPTTRSSAPRSTGCGRSRQGAHTRARAGHSGSSRFTDVRDRCMTIGRRRSRRGDRSPPRRRHDRGRRALAARDRERDRSRCVRRRDPRARAARTANATRTREGPSSRPRSIARTKPLAPPPYSPAPASARPSSRRSSERYVAGDGGVHAERAPGSIAARSSQTERRRQLPNRTSQTLLASIRRYSVRHGTWHRRELVILATGAKARRW